MGAFVNGDVIVVPFPFSASTGAKRRPAIVVASWPFGSGTDYLLCLVSSQRVADPYLVTLAVDDIEGGTLTKNSYARPTYLFALDEALIAYKIGHLKQSRLSEIVDRIKSLFP